MLRAPRVETARTLAPSAISAAGGSCAGSAWARPPPTVAMLRIRTVATRPYVSASSGAASRTSGEVSTSR